MRCLVVVVIFLFSQTISALQAFLLSRGETCSKQIIIVFSEHTHYNSHIVRDRKTFHDRRLSENCVTMVKHFMDEEGNILSFADFYERFPNMGLDFLTYDGLVSSVMTY